MKNLLAHRFDAIAFPTSVQDAVERGIPLVMVAKATGPESLLQAIEFEILTVAGLLNLNAALTIKPGQSQVAAQAIFDNFSTESLEDLKLAFRRGASGLYGEIFRLDGAVLVKWIQCYLEEKYVVVERLQAKAKQKQRDNDDNFDPKAFYDSAKEWADKKREIEQDKHKQAIEDRRKEAVFAMERAGMVRDKFLCDGIEVTAASEHYARIAYQEMFKRLPESVVKVEVESQPSAENEK